MDKGEILFLGLIAFTLIAGLAIPILIVRSKFLGRLSRTSLEAGIKHKRLAITTALSLCALASFSIVVSRTVEVPGSPMYFMIGPSGACWAAVLFSAWVIARTSPSWRAVSLPQRTLLVASFAWAFALLFVV